MSPVAAPSQVLEPLRRPSPVPPEAAYAWFTDFSPEDAGLIPMLRVRRVTRGSARDIRLDQVVDDGSGPEVINVLVRLRPPLGYDATVEGTTTTVHFDFVPAGKGSQLVVRFDEDTPLSRSLRKGISANIDALFPAMAKELGY